MRRFLKELPQKARYWRTVLWQEYDTKAKLLWLLQEVTNVIITGILLWLAVDYLRSNNLFLHILSYGLLSALALYYLDAVVETIRKKR